MRDDDYAELERFLGRRGDAMLATAVLLTGSRPAGEDLLQAALEKVVRGWKRVSGDPEAYVRRALYTLAVDQWRYRGRRPEALVSAQPPPQADGSEAVALRLALLQGLRALPARQRAVLVLRYWEHLSEAEAAAVLGCSVGTVKSSTSRGLARLRELTADWTHPNSERSLR